MTGIMAEDKQFSVTMPHDVEGTGIRRGLLEDLALKILYLHGETSLIQLADLMCVSLGVVEEIFHFFRHEQLCEVKGITGGVHRIVATQEGRQRAAGLLSLNQYAGPAPVSLADYTARVRMQSLQNGHIGPKEVERALDGLVLDDALRLRVGTAVVSGTSMFLYGPTGTGKTSIATRLPTIYPDMVWVPHAIEVEGQIIAVYDPGVHQRNAALEPEEADRRWVLCQRPGVLTGGELTLEMFEVQYNAATRYSTAPAQMKANNGVLILDDFGRQRVSPQELLNRWMTVLERRVEFLTLPGGHKFEIPFDVLVVFSTNIAPLQLGDQAFVRRIPNKILVRHATEEQFREIFHRDAASGARKLKVDPEVLDYLVRHLRDDLKQPFTQCFPRDILDQIFWAAKYRHAKPEFTRELAEWACSNYFFAGVEKQGP
jgi:predicted ATPase with chaperone activity